MKVLCLMAACLVFIGCDKLEGAPTYTLYRNSSLSLQVANVQMRLHVATFYVEDSKPYFNRNNCKMSARLYNANIVALNPSWKENSIQPIGFWCERGNFKEGEDIPDAFDAKFPTDTE